jgi:hypothetical protein
MKPTPFNPETDLSPIPFDEQHRHLAAQLKEAGLTWKPHVGCFVWDRDKHIEVGSPFPNRIYFILNLGHFLRIFGTIEAVAEKLIWLPTHHQARLLCDRLGVDAKEIDAAPSSGKISDGLLALYRIILTKLGNKKTN